MLVDSDRVVLRLKHELQAKRSWGADELFRLIARLEVESVLDGDAPRPDELMPSGAEHEGPLPGSRDSRSEGMSRDRAPLLPEGGRNGIKHEAGVGSR